MPTPTPHADGLTALLTRCERTHGPDANLTALARHVLAISTRLAAVEARGLPVLPPERAERFVVVPIRGANGRPAEYHTSLSGATSCAARYNEKLGTFTADGDDDADGASWAVIDTQPESDAAKLAREMRDGTARFVDTAPATQPAPVPPPVPERGEVRTIPVIAEDAILRHLAPVTPPAVPEVEPLAVPREKVDELMRDRAEAIDRDALLWAIVALTDVLEVTWKDPGMATRAVAAIDAIVKSGTPTATLTAERLAEAIEKCPFWIATGELRPDGTHESMHEDDAAEEILRHLGPVAPPAVPAVPEAEPVAWLVEPVYGVDHRPEPDPYMSRPAAERAAARLRVGDKAASSVTVVPLYRSPPAVPREVVTPKSETARSPEPSLDAARCGTSSVAGANVAPPTDIPSPDAAAALLDHLRTDENKPFSTPFGERAWLKPCLDETGKRIGLTECCLVDDPCPKHATMPHGGAS